MEIVALSFFTLHLFVLHLVSGFQLAWVCFTRRFTIPVIVVMSVAILLFGFATWQIYNQTLSLQAAQLEIEEQLRIKKNQEIEFWEHQSQQLQSRAIWLKLGQLYQDNNQSDKATSALQKAYEIDPN